MLRINNLHAGIQDKAILNGFNLEINPGEVHAIMGPNGSGKSTLSNVLTGKPGYTIERGEALFFENNLLEMEAEERAQLGIFLAMQYPVEIPGLNNLYFLKAALNSQRKANNLPELDAMDFMQMVKEKMKTIGLTDAFLQRAVNEGFSGGEKKRNEILQMMVLQPKLVILDEIDSGLDIDALQTIAEGVNSMRRTERSFIIITHYQRLLDYIVPDYVHIMQKGKIVKSGDKSLAKTLDEKGYQRIEEASS